ncbi:MAG TPA: hypothetical protein VHF26_10935 [Trebonia sp.]|nr:hypothetical protein [Trebonia sp.]
MRHVIGFLLAVGLAAAVFFAASWGYLRLLRVPVMNGGASTLPAQGGSLLHATTVLEAVAAVAGTALLAGIFIAVRQISPLAAGLPGLVLIAWTVGYGFSVRRAVHYIPLRGDTFGTGFEAMLFNGILGAAGLALVVPLFIPSRWRRTSRWAAVGPPSTPYGYTYPEGAAPASESPTITLLTDDWTGTTPPQDSP